MGLYIYHNDKTEETIEVFQKMLDVHVYSGVSGNEEGWRRVFTVPQACVDNNLDPRNREEFARRAAKYSTIGDLADKSRELSEKRKSKDGYDPVEKKFFEDYSAFRKGAKHHLDKPKKIETSQVTVDFTAKD